jgi:zinc/manganese transport system substrate-binding protein
MAGRRSGWRGRLGAALVVALLCVAAACSSDSDSNAGASGSAGSTSGAGTKLQVVAAENFWGSIASQLGGDHVQVTSIITSPDSDPHDYEPTPQDGRAIASAKYVIFNGIGYDTWAGQAVDANPATDRKVLEIGKLLNLKEGDNPHRWYFPDNVDKVIAQITADYKKLDPANASYYDQQKQAYETTGLKAYKDLITEIKQKYAGTPVGASESIFVGIAQATGLDLKTPPDFLTAISEGTDPTAKDKATTDRQITSKEIKVFVFNSQNSTPDIQTLVDAAHANSIPVATVTETPDPGDLTFQDWQSQQLQQLRDALARATGK